MLGLNNLQIVKKMNTKNLKNERPNLPKSNQERPKTDHNGQKKTLEQWRGGQQHLQAGSAESACKSQDRLQK